MVDLDYGGIEVMARRLMESFVLTGKASIVFQLLKLKAGVEKDKSKECKK